MLLGSSKRSQNNFFIQHSTGKEDYVLFKKQLLEQITKKTVNVRVVHLKDGDLIRVEPKQIPLTRILLKKLYPRGTKTVTRKFLNLLTIAGIAIWFLDVGSKSFKRKNGKIHALEITLNTSLSQEENEIIISYFSEVWGFKWGLSKNKTSYRLRMGTQEGKRFLTFIKPYVPDSMLYKIETSLNRTATT